VNNNNNNSSDNNNNINNNNNNNSKSDVISIIMIYFDNNETMNQSQFLSTIMTRILQSLDSSIHDDTPYKSLFPLSTSDYLGFLCATLGLLIAAGGGVGGGGILVPVYCLVLGFSPKHAIPLSNVTVFGGAVANLLLNWSKRHPLANRPLIDWDLILVMEPFTIAGALIGSFWNKLLDEQILTILLVILLSATSYESLSKAIKMFRAETKAMRVTAAAAAKVTTTTDWEVLTKETETSNHLSILIHEQDKELIQDERLPLVQHIEQPYVNEEPNQSQQSYSHDIEPCEPVDDNQKAHPISDLDRILDEESVTPKYNVKILCLMFVVVLIMNLLKGGGAFQSPLGIRCGSMSFWIANALMIFWILAIHFQGRAHLLQRHEQKQNLGYCFYVEGDIPWNARTTMIYPLLCGVAGLVAGMFGIGGGIVKGPLMLAMGVHPAVSSASSACMILFTSFTATTSYVVFGLLLMDYGILCLIIGFLATLVGQLCLSALMKRYQRNSLIAFSIGGVVLLSAILMSIQSILALVSGKSHPSGGICGNED
jgi:uncharacterized membrane protein YfcA